jgi:hypothetical protein
MTYAAKVFGVDVLVLLPALGAAAAVLTFLLRPGGVLLRWLRKPRLRLTFDAASQPVITTMYWNDDHPNIKLSIVRLDVGVVGLAPRAEQVQVLVSRISVERDGAAEEDAALRALRNLPLAWSGTDVRDPHAEGEPRDIPGGQPWQVDLVHVNELFPDELRLDSRPRMPGDPQWLNAPTAHVELAVVGSNARTRRYTITVHLTQRWDDAAAPAHFAVRGPQRS